MSFYRFYVGDAATCKWDAPAWNHFNLPKGVVDLGGIGLGACITAYGLIEKYGGRQLDWGAYGGKVTKEQIVAVLTEFPNGEGINDAWRITAIEEVEAALEDGKTYALVAYET